MRFSERLIIAGSLFLAVFGCCNQANCGTPSGFVAGQLKILSLKEVELAGGRPSKFKAEKYAEYPLVVLTADRKKEVTRITADAEGNYRLELPPGNYVLDVQGRALGLVRAKPQRFTVVSNQIVRVDMDVDTGIR